MRFLPWTLGLVALYNTECGEIYDFYKTLEEADAAKIKHALSDEWITFVITTSHIIE